jgi:hypothetical protein
MPPPQPPSEALVLSLEAVNALIPDLQRLVEGQLRMRATIQAALGKLAEELGDVPNAIVMSPDDSDEMRAYKQELVSQIERYRAGWRQVESMGGVVKDARNGLVDFYGRVDGQLVWLCWKVGEDEVTHYHALNEGFSARRSLKDSMKMRMLN